MRYLVLSFLFLSGCAVGPNFKRPTPPPDSNYGTASIDHYVVDLDIPAQWWTLFKSPQLDSLVHQAIQSNADLDAARAALRQAHELYLAQRTTFFPTVQGEFDGQRAKNAVGTIANPTNLPQENPYYNLYTAQLTVSYMPDIFGGQRRAVEAARAQDNSTRFQLEATYLTLSSNVVVTAIQEAGLREQVAATKRVLELQHDLTGKTRQQKELGTASNLDVLTQEATEASTAATLAPLEKQLGQTHDALTALLGKLPAEEPSEAISLDQLTLPTELPVSLPSKLVEQRPDIRQAEENLHYASAEAGVALADMLPQFAITGNWGSTALRSQDLFKTGTGFWSIGASLTQTLFDAGALLHRHRAADAALDQAGAQYRSAVILACQNVADSLRALQADSDALTASTQSARVAKDAFDLARQQRELGSISMVAVLSSEALYQQAELNRIQAQANRYADTAALFQALGGGWWNRPSGSKL